MAAAGGGGAAMAAVTGRVSGAAIGVNAMEAPYGTRNRMSTPMCAGAQPFTGRLWGFHTGNGMLQLNLRVDTRRK